MTDLLAAPLQNLADIQRRAVDWDDGAMLVLAGPGSGKTQVLTCRIARLLDSYRERSFRVLALTFTNKAADEMKTRVADFVPGLEERATIGTFHGFCGQILRQHGVHVDIRPDFTIYSQEADRRAVLEDGLRRAASKGRPVGIEDVRYLGLIDRLKSLLVAPEDAEQRLSSFHDRVRIAVAYEAYEEELRRLNVLDFNSLILGAYRLTKTYPAIAARYRRSYPYWLLDEFQDTNDAQYRLIESLAGGQFTNVFAVADDDQIIYQWNGASFRQIQRFRTDFAAEVIQLPTNYRCPPAIVDAANKLVSYNVNRAVSKKPLQAGKALLKFPEPEHIQVREFETQDGEAAGIATEISTRGPGEWGQIAVLARTRALLDTIRVALKRCDVPAVVAQRRDDFLSPEFRWWVACLVQTARPLDRRNINVLVGAYNRFAEIDIDVNQVTSDAEATGKSYVDTWLETTRQFTFDARREELLGVVGRLTAEPGAAKGLVDTVVELFEGSIGSGEVNEDLVEDLKAWREISRDIALHVGRDAPLDQFLQELQLRSKEPSPQSGTVTLMTVHGAKGREFDVVYLIGLAEDILPSFQSRRKGGESAEMEEERRNCFVGITRAKECLVVSRAREYRGWPKEPSRFLVEMELVERLALN